jgi:hypothetical protein
MSKHTMLIVSVAAIALAAGTGGFALAEQTSPEVLGELADNQGIFVDGKTFKIVRGAAKGDVDHNQAHYLDALLERRVKLGGPNLAEMNTCGVASGNCGAQRCSHC